MALSAEGIEMSVYTVFHLHHMWKCVWAVASQGSHLILKSFDPDSQKQDIQYMSPITYVHCVSDDRPAGLCVCAVCDVCDV